MGKYVKEIAILKEQKKATKEVLKNKMRNKRQYDKNLKKNFYLKSEFRIVQLKLMQHKIW
jgi:hypothetical protein